MRPALLVPLAALALLAVASSAQALPLVVGPVAVQCGGVTFDITITVPPDVTATPPTCTVSVLGTTVTLPP
jgi:hypothetical protein